jgi:hypothetical protein
MADLPASDIENAPLDEFADPQSGIASILQQMQGAATRSRPPLDTIQNANRPMPTARGMSPDELIRMLLAQQGR